MIPFIIGLFVVIFIFCLAFGKNRRKETIIREDGSKEKRIIEEHTPGRTAARITLAIIGIVLLVVVGLVCFFAYALNQ
jgi:hypothetical protein